MTTEVIISELAEQRHDLAELQQWQRNRLKAVEAEQLKLMQAHYADAVPLEILKAEQARLGSERIQLEGALRESIAGEQQLRNNADAAVRRLKHCHLTYEQMKNRERRMMNQAFFKRIWVTEDGIVGWEYNEPFATLMRRHEASEPHLVVEYMRSPQSEAEDRMESALNREITRRSPGQWARAYLDQSLKQNNLAERVGFEPTVACTTQHFECCTFGLSDTAPSTRLPAAPRGPNARSGQGQFGQEVRGVLLSAKNEVRRAPHSAALMPAVMGVSWLSRGSAHRL